MTRLYFFLLFLVAYSKYASAVMTPTVEIIEESPTGPKRVFKDEKGETIIIGLEGQPVVLECLPKNIDSSAKVLWMWHSLKDDGLFEVINDGMRAKDTSRWKITRGTSTKNAIRLEIPTVSQSYAGRLECRILYEDHTQPVSAKRTLRVFALPRIVQYQSSFESTVQENTNATLRCNATGIPKPQIYWKRIGGSSSVIRGYGREFVGTKIVFTKTKPEDRGTYVCKAINTMGSATWKIKLNVMFKPRVIIYRPSVRAEVKQKVGCEMQLLCTVMANPAPDSIMWSVADSSITADTRRQIYKMQGADYTTYYSVSFEPTRASDFGEYQCSARNSKGSDTQTITFSETAEAQRTRSGPVRCGALATAPAAWLPSLLLLLAAGAWRQ